MPVTDGKAEHDISQRAQYAKGGIGRWHWDRRDQAAMKYVVGNKVLDAGCGEGITLEKLVARFPEKEFLGVDPDPKNIKLCEAHMLPVIQGDVYDLPFENESLDTCLFMEVIEHLETPKKALEELIRVLRPGGRLIVVFPYDITMLAARLLCLRWREARFDPYHLKQWSLRELRSLSRSLGVTLLAAKGLPFPFPCALHGLFVAEKKVCPKLG